MQLSEGTMFFLRMTLESTVPYNGKSTDSQVIPITMKLHRDHSRTIFVKIESRSLVHTMCEGHVLPRRRRDFTKPHWQLAKGRIKRLSNEQYILLYQLFTWQNNEALRQVGLSVNQLFCRFDFDWIGVLHQCESTLTAEIRNMNYLYTVYLRCVLGHFLWCTDYHRVSECGWNLQRDLCGAIALLGPMTKA